MNQEHIYKKYDNNIPMNYECYFVPLIGKPLAEDLINMANIKPGEKVLDIACGTGIATRYALQKVGSDGSVAGLDPNPGMLAVARKVTENRNSIGWYESPAEDIPLADNTFDVILCQLGLQFIEEKVVALKEMLRV